MKLKWFRDATQFSVMYRESDSNSSVSLCERFMYTTYLGPKKRYFSSKNLSKIIPEVVENLLESLTQSCMAIYSARLSKNRVNWYRGISQTWQLQRQKLYSVI
jgi:hypothetical protein